MDLLSGLAVLLIGWPGIIAAFVFVSIGIYSKRLWVVVLGAIFAMPISWYLGSTPKFRYIMYALPILFIGSALAVKFGKNRLAWALFLPYVGIVGWLAFTVINQ